VYNKISTLRFECRNQDSKRYLKRRKIIILWKNRKYKSV